MSIDYSFISDKGIKKKCNQDAVEVFKNSRGNLLSVVCDGVSSHMNSSFSSNYVVKELGEYWKSNIFENVQELEKKITNKIVEIDKILNNKSSNMATTLLLSIIYENNLLVFNVGDSLAYGIGKEGEIELLSRDDSFAGVLFAAGVINKEEAKNHYKKNYLTQALASGKRIKINKNLKHIDKYTYIINATDGLTNMIDIDEIAEIVRNNELSKAINILVKEANNRGGEDNISISIFKI